MRESLAERGEQISALLDARNPENEERVAAELERTILTVHIPREVQEALAAAVQPLHAPILFRLSPRASVANPLAPMMIVGLSDGKLMLDAMRMLYAELYSVENLELDEEDRTGALIVQEQPTVSATWRVLQLGTNTVVEGTRGLGCWVGAGEPDRFLFANGAFQRAENGDTEGVTWDDGITTFDRTPLGGDDAQQLLEFAKPYLDACTQPLLFGTTDSGFVCLGASTHLNKK
jgi:hypothetical protein